ncbi:hypothetical protein PPERSA_13082 [Pseudocohnilembus persalinus]|uniref:Uncharacterized protein n=1 Tax=Pseudocohnilembus persalinus TaxID=266149 RepID=A0A0V0QWJ5_PSEPJ|nr:hypothetical protein PPERSA_13082 [Pseudocohnilembus persalinus]|eukprot:KRX06603.1 hypothetical protein PPERSA_13082 [Pseudocohnilembus persalinus]
MIQRNGSKRGTIKLRSSELEEPVEFEVPLSRTQKKKLTIKRVSKLLSENSVSSFQKAEQISSVLTYGQFLPKQNERGDLIFTEGNDIQYMKSQVNQNFDSKLIQSKIKSKNFQSASNMQNIIEKNGSNANSCYSDCVSNFSQNVKGQLNEKWSFAMSDSFSPAKKQEKKKKKIYMNESQTPQTQRMLTMKKNKENLQKILMNTSSKPADSFKNKNEDNQTYEKIKDILRI